MSRPLSIVVLIASLAPAFGCGGSPSSTLPPPPVPNISVSPTSVAAGSSDLTLTIMALSTFTFTNAQHKFNQAIWSVNGSKTPLSTTFVSSTQLSALMPSDLLINSVTAKIWVEIWDDMGDAPDRTSNSVSFDVTLTLPGTPSISSISPSSAVAGSPDLTLTVVGANFVNEGATRYHSGVTWSVNGHDSFLTTTIIDSTHLTADIPTALLSNPTTAQISVQTWHFADDVPTSVSNFVSFKVRSP